MTKYYRYLFLALPLFFTGCLKEQANLFPDTAAVRLNNTIERIDSTLTHAPNGWIMEYFATAESPGYSMLIRFETGGEVVVAAKNELVGNKYTEAKSLYDVIGDNGPDITFNTYNDVLHIFSNPVDPYGTGLNGDYEFIVIDYRDSIMHLKGKKRGTYIKLEKLPEGVSWADYFTGLEKIDNEIIGAEPLYFISGTDTFAAHNGASHIFELLSYKTGDVTNVPFIVTSDGIRFYAPFAIGNNKKVQSFYLSDDGNKLISKEDKNTFFIGTDISLYFQNSQETFAFDTTQMSDHYKIPVRELCRQMKERYSGKRNIDFLALSYKTGFGRSFHFITKPTKTIANYSIEVSSDNSSKGTIIINKVNGVYDPNGAIFISSVPIIDEVWGRIAGTYHLRSTVSRNEIKFVDKNDATRYFVVIKR